MWSLLHSLALLLGAVIFPLAKAEAPVHALVDGFRGPENVLSALERDAESLVARQVPSHQGKDENRESGGWHGGIQEYKGYGAQGSNYASGGGDKSRATVFIELTEKATKGVGTVAAAGEQRSTVMETITISAAAVVGAATSIGSGQQGSPAVQVSFVTTTIFQSGPVQTVTVNAIPMTQIITQTQMVTITTAGTCSNAGLATGVVGTTVATAMGTESQTVVSPMSLTNAVSAPTQATTSNLATSPTSISLPSVGSSGEVAKGTGVINAAGYCDCSCLCVSGSFLSFSSMSASPAIAVPTTMQTVASSADAQGISSASILDTEISSTVSAATLSSISGVAIGGNAISTSSSSSGSAALVNQVSTPNTSASPTAAATSSPPETATSSVTLTTSATSTDASAQPGLVTDAGTVATVPSQSSQSSQSSAQFFTIVTSSLRTSLVLGNLASQATYSA